MLGVAGVSAAVAACSRHKASNGGGGGNKNPSGSSVGGGGGGGNNNGGGSSGNAVFRAWYPYSAPPAGNYNTLSGILNSIPQAIGYLYDYIVLPGAMYMWKDQKYVFFLADPSSKLSADGKTFTYKVRLGQKWNDGKPITAKDVYATWMCKYVVRSPAYDYIDSVEMTDAMTVTFHIPKAAPIAQYYILRERIVPESVYGTFSKQAEPLAKAKKDQADKAVVALNKKLSAFNPPGDVVGSGPYTLDKSTVSTTQLTLKKNANCYFANTVKWDSVICLGSSDFTTIIPVILQKQVYYNTGALTVAVESQVKKAGLRILRPPIYSGPAIFFNYDKVKEFGDKRARQALCQAFDHTQSGKVALGDSGKEINLYAGISDTLAKQYMSAAGLKKLMKYPFDVDAAAKKFKAAGWSKRGSSWYTPSGSLAKYELLYPSDYPDWSASASNLVGQMENFGIKLVGRGEQSTVVPVDVKASKFTMAIQGWGSSSNPFPADAYRSALFNLNLPVLRPSQKGMDFPMKQTTEVEGKVDLEQVVIASSYGITPDDLKKSVTTAGLAFNELLPVIPLWERYGNNAALESAVKGYPSDGDAIYDNSPYADNFTTLLTFDGTLTPA